MKAKKIAALGLSLMMTMSLCGDVLAADIPVQEEPATISVEDIAGETEEEEITFAESADDGTEILKLMRKSQSRVKTEKKALRMHFHQKKTRLHLKAKTLRLIGNWTEITEMRFFPGMRRKMVP